ncbi:MAG: hypothetical protein J7639_05770 [Paenibacillaceae bacterium]|nr:hypothetical protein [Paenibacillaceae bacterium]
MIGKKVGKADAMFRFAGFLVWRFKGGCGLGSFGGCSKIAHEKWLICFFLLEIWKIASEIAGYFAELFDFATLC